MDYDAFVYSNTIAAPIVCTCVNRPLCDCAFFETLPAINTKTPYYPRDINTAWIPPVVCSKISEDFIIGELIRIGGIVKSLIHARDAVADYFELHAWNSEGNKEYCKYLNTTLHITMWNLKKNWEMILPHLPATHKCYIPRVDVVYSHCKILYHKILTAEANNDY